MFAMNFLEKQVKVDLQKFNFSLILIVLTVSVTHVSAQIQKQLIEERNPSVFSGFEILDPDGLYTLEYSVDWQRRRIVFDLTVETNGYVLLGLSAKGFIAGADVVIGGVMPNGNSYLTDRHGADNRTLPQVDESQDWDLIRATEYGRQTRLTLERAFDTCDGDDYVINEYDTITLIWGYGSSDNPSQDWPPQKMGVYPMYLLDPNTVPRSLKQSTYQRGPPSRNVLAENNLKLWTISTRSRIPPKETTYQCTVHKSPPLGRKHHIVGFHTRLESEDALKHTHHIDLYRCSVPPGQSASRIFEPLLNHPGQECYIMDEPTGPIPTDNCVEISYVFAIGARIYFYPDHAGQDLSGDQYYVMQVHYNNVDRRSDLNYQVNLDVFYTDQLRSHEVGILTIGHSTPGAPSILIPPNTPSHEVYGHCSPQCAERMIPEEGINALMVVLHTHDSGRKIRLRHFRGNQELPWIGEDSNYDNTFQNFRNLRNEVNIKRGDHLMIQCENDNTWTNETVVGGFATRQEMCLAFLTYYNKMEGYGGCRSEINDVTYMRRYLGINNGTWSLERLDVVATSPASRAGMTVTEISDNLVPWTPQLRRQLQNDHRNLPQKSECILSPFVAVQRGELSAQDLATGNLAQWLQTQNSGFVRRPIQPSEFNPPQRTCGISNRLGDRRGAAIRNNLGAFGVLTNQIGQPNIWGNRGQGLGWGNVLTWGRLGSSGWGRNRG